jgi:hypothetical protein
LCLKYMIDFAFDILTLMFVKYSGLIYPSVLHRASGALGIL